MKAVIAVDLGATNTRIGLYENSRPAADPVTFMTPRYPRDVGEITSLLTDRIRQMFRIAGVTEIKGIGISVAGPVDHQSGSVIRPPNIPLPAIPLETPLTAEFGVPVRLINDCHAGVLGEAYFGILSSEKNAVYLTMSTGIGAGIISEGKILLGKRGNAGEVGHFFVDDRYHCTCGCGFPGHWEAYASGRFLPEFFTRWCAVKGIATGGDRNITPDQVFSLIRKDREKFEGFLDDLGRINARGISDIVVAYEPACLILDGSVVRENLDLILPFIEKYADRFLPLPSVGLSRLGGSAPLLGASVIACGYDTLVGNFLPDGFVKTIH
jgi:glucokinase